MRTILTLVTLSCAAALLVHCGGGDDSSAAGPVIDASSPTDSTVVTNDSGPADSGPPATRVDVDGFVYGRNGDDGPIANRDVVIVDALGVVTKVVSDANGKFQAPGIATPYDIVALFEPGDAATLGTERFYGGVTRPDPAIHAIDYYAAAPVTHNQSTISFTATACDNCKVMLTSSGANSGATNASLTGVGGGNQPYSTSYFWTGPSTTLSGAFHLGIQDPDGGAFTAAAQIPAETLTAGAPTDLGTITEVPLGSASLTLTSTIPAGYTLQSGAVMDSSYADGAGAGQSLLPSGSGTFVVPAISGTNVFTTLSVTGPQGNSSAALEQPFAASLTASLTFATPPTSLVPADNATGVTDAQTMSWSAVPGAGVYSVFIDPVSPAQGLRFIVNVPSTSFDLARLTKAGISFYPASNYTWSVSAGNTYPTIDAFVIPPPASPYPLSRMVQTATSTTQSFTTK